MDACAPRIGDNPVPNQGTYSVVVKALAFLIPALVAALFLVFQDREKPGSPPPPEPAITLAIPPVVTPDPPSPPATSPALSGRASVVDADTLDVGGTRVRLFGIDAPEKNQTCERNGTHWACGSEAAVALAVLLGDEEVRCEARGSDRNRRLIGLCWTGTIDVSRWMVEHGWAVAYRRFAADYADAEDAARNERRGLWAGNFETPEDWRRRQRGTAR
jgi:endonuclease YncB( thermonuclease family)